MPNARTLHKAMRRPRGASMHTLIKIAHHNGLSTDIVPALIRKLHTAGRLHVIDSEHQYPRYKLHK